MTNGKKLRKIPLALLAEEALKKAVADVIREHKKSGDPIAIWRDGKVVKIPADQIEVHEAQADHTNNKRTKLRRSEKVPKAVTPVKTGVQTSSRRKSGTKPLNPDSDFHPPGRSPLRDRGRND